MDDDICWVDLYFGKGARESSWDLLFQSAALCRIESSQPFNRKGSEQLFSE